MQHALEPNDLDNPATRARRVGPESNEWNEKFELSDTFVDLIEKTLQTNDGDQAKILVQNLHYADMADLLERLDHDDRRLLVEAIREDFNPDILPELAGDVRDEIINTLGFEDFAVALAALDSDDAVYVAGKLGPSERAHILSRMPDATRRLIEQGLAYSERSAGRLMQQEFVAVPNYWTVGETIDYLRATPNIPEKFYAVFVVDPRHRPLGVAELSAILRSKRPTGIGDILDHQREIVSTDMEDEEVAFLFRQRDLTAAPVVDRSGRLVGQITIDDIVDVMDDEAGQDFLKLAGVRHDDSAGLYGTILATARSRFFWLCINLATALLASSVIGFFEHSIEKLAALAVLMPICASMGGNAGTQTLATVIRALATRQLNANNVWRVAWQETLVGLINGCLFAGITGLTTYLWFDNGTLGAVLAATMVLNLVVAGISGMMIPLFLERLGADPADSAAVFLTTITDVVAFFSFLGLATLILL